MPSLTVFLDSSVILSGLASPTGGSGKLLYAGKKQKIKLITNKYIIQEVQSHLNKLSLSHNQLAEMLSSHTIGVLSDPPASVTNRFINHISDPNDASVIAGAAISGAQSLISLDKKHILVPKIRQLLKPMQVQSPKEFWKWIREEHNKIYNKKVKTSDVSPRMKRYRKSF